MPDYSFLRRRIRGQGGPFGRRSDTPQRVNIIGPGRQTRQNESRGDRPLLLTPRMRRLRKMMRPTGRRYELGRGISEKL